LCWIEVVKNQNTVLTKYEFSTLTVASIGTKVTASYTIATNQDIYITVIPCYGSFDVQFFCNNESTTVPWSSAVDSIVYKFADACPDTCIVTITGKQKYASGIAICDVYVSDVQSGAGSFASTYPSIGSGTLTGTVDEKAETGTVTWTIASGGWANDTYTFYRSSSAPESGDIKLTACGVKKFLTAQTYTQTKSGSTRSVTVPNTDQADPAYVSVVATRSGGYQVAYKFLTLNSASSISISAILIFGLLISFFYL